MRQFRSVECQVFRSTKREINKILKKQKKYAWMIMVHESNNVRTYLTAWHKG